jgi:hypothetical protein
MVDASLPLALVLATALVLMFFFFASDNYAFPRLAVLVNCILITGHTRNTTVVTEATESTGIKRQRDISYLHHCPVRKKNTTSGWHEDGSSWAARYRFDDPGDGKGALCLRTRKLPRRLILASARRIEGA